MKKSIYNVAASSKKKAEKKQTKLDMKIRKKEEISEMGRKEYRKSNREMRKAGREENKRWF